MRSSSHRHTCTYRATCAILQLDLNKKMIGITSDSSCIVGKPVLVRRTSKARRCLFGPVDHEEVKKSLHIEMAKINEENNSRWNFDFKSDTPLSGKFNWQKVGDADQKTVPAAYNMPNLTKMLAALTSHLSLTQAQRTSQVKDRTSLKRKQSEITGKSTHSSSLIRLR